MSKSVSTITRIGQIDFSNCLPVNLPISQGKVDIELQAQFHPDNPARLNEMLGRGELDISAVSSFFYLQNRERQGLTLLPGLSIASRGDVGSVLFFHSESLELLPDRPVAVPDTSLTSINLLKLMIHESTGKMPELLVLSQVELDGLIESDRLRAGGQDFAGILLIGDHALKADESLGSRLARTDLGRWWWDRTGLPMVFGLWAGRSAFVSANEYSFQLTARALNLACKAGLSDCFEAVLEAAGRKTGLDRERLRHYYTGELNYQLSDEHIAGLELFRTMLKDNELLK
ncbi:MAG: menaquinone biosynthesis protein [Candidatus Melainabacteria bacterium]|nr:menaquinone biosynthesis protein [Candidatus Melainabacteria bacterium]